MLNSLLPNIPWKNFFIIVKRCNLLKIRSLMLLFFYYFITTLSGFIDGISMVLLVDLVMNAKGLSTSAAIHQFLTLIPGKLGTVDIYLVIVALFFGKAILTFGVTQIEGYMEARVRQLIQVNGVKSVLEGDWEFLRDMRVGQRVGAITEESTRVSQLVMSIIRSIYGLTTTIILSVMAVMISFQVAILFFLIGVPVLLLLRQLFSIQGKIAERLVNERQGFFASITERLIGLLQVKVENDTAKHLGDSLNYQERLTKLEIRYWLLKAIITGVNSVVPAMILLAFFIWVLIRHQPLTELLYYIASVGAVGMRVINYVNIATASISNITAFSGSIIPVYELLTIPEDEKKICINEKIVAVHTKEINYGYKGRDVISGIDTCAAIGRPLVIKGPSGAGKSTLANIIAGLYRPRTGAVVYTGLSGKQYTAGKYRPKIGYVTQDIHLFHGSVKDNLAHSNDVNGDDFLLDCLRKAGADKFIHSIGGLNAILAEAGRSLSGGERRRLGIARALTKMPDLLVLDEVTAGLDESKKAGILETIRELSRSLVVIMITHDIDITSLSSDAISLYLDSDGKAK